jgi:FdhE protein
MTQIGAPPAGHDPVPIGEVSAPPFARLPDPAALFHGRAARLHALAQGHPLAPYLDFVAAIAAAQHAIQDGLPRPSLPEADALARAREFGMPALDRATLLHPASFLPTLRRLLGAVAALEMPEPARLALRAVTEAEDELLLAMGGNVIDAAIPFDAIAEHGFVAAGLQVQAARAAALLDAASLAPVSDGVCPACGSPPVASVVVGWEGASGARFCTCSLCATQWHHVRIRCTACGSGKGITYRELEGGDDAVKAECCRECSTYLKIMHHTRNPALDPVADDIASSALDVLVREEGFSRSGVNPFLLGY